ncbi:hypothetical protein [Asticcacaulis sp. W401b]|uniref:hypothetical protein n=1 Tax=Asticcacaulis sp. W401b TaxID=3388666 RepID=UPI003970F556
MGVSGLRCPCAPNKVVPRDLNAELLETTAKEIGAAGFVALDVSKLEEVSASDKKSAGILGKIDILVASVAAKEGNPNPPSAYSASKAGVIGFPRQP